MVKSCTVEPEVFGMTEDKLDSLERALTRINETVMSGSIFRNCITQVPGAGPGPSPPFLPPPACGEQVCAPRASESTCTRQAGLSAAGNLARGAGLRLVMVGTAPNRGEGPGRASSRAKSGRGHGKGDARCVRACGCLRRMCVCA
jgi:hypothetical protein